MKEHLKYAFVDMDRDGIEELVIDCSDTILLRYFEEHPNTRVKFSPLDTSDWDAVNPPDGKG